MPIHLTQNPYKGINAHFQSFLQSSEGGWTTFHNDHIAHLKTIINKSLPSGYYAVTEKSLQIQLPEANLPTRPDIAIFRKNPPVSSSVQQTMTPTVEMTDAIIDDEDLSAIIVYFGTLGRFVTRIELLSPTNKTTHLQEYLSIRNYMYYKLGVNMVEIDYLHETPTIFPEMTPNYPKKAKGAYPYSIAISSPYREKRSLYCFQIEEAMPILAIPLKEEDNFLLNFGEAYNFSYEDDRRAHLLLDYEQLPLNFDKYIPSDQQKIRAVMARIASTKKP